MSKLFLGIVFALFEAVVSAFPAENLFLPILFWQRKLFDIIVLKDFVFVIFCISLLLGIVLIAFLWAKKGNNCFWEHFAKVLGIFFCIVLYFWLLSYPLQSDWEDCMDYRGKWNEKTQSCEEIPLLQQVY